MRTASFPQRVYSDDEIHERILSSAEFLLDAFLGKQKRPYSCTSRTRIKDMPTIQRELKITKRLEAYFQDRTAYLKEEEKIQKKLRVGYSYSHLPKLPTEMITRILSYIPSENVVKTRDDDILSVTIEGLLPQVIFKPYLLKPPCCVDFKEELTAEKFNELKMSSYVLTDPDVSRSTTLQVQVNGWPMGSMFQDELDLLLRMRNRCKLLTLKFSITKQTIPMLVEFKELLPCLKKLAFLKKERYFEIPPGLATVDTTGAIKADWFKSLKEIDLSFCILPTLYDHGILGSITSLHFTEIDTSLDHANRFNTYRDASDRFSHILSSLPLLTSLSVDYVVYEQDRNLPKINSSSLRSLEVKRSYDNLIPFLALFSECPIEDLEVHHEEPTLENLAKFFPGLKRLAFRRTVDMRAFLVHAKGETPIFPKLEELTICARSRDSGVVQAVKRAIVVRSFTPGCGPMKKFTVKIQSVSDEPRANVTGRPITRVL